ncbi:MAG: Gfo/Idh/MocA family oxidoreductase [Bacteroidota bacterium]
MTKTINWGIIGPGRIARKFADGLKVLPDAKLLAIASRSIETATQFGDDYQVPYRYGSYEELVQNPEVDVVYIATPHVGHYAHTLLCLQHGKAVLCEKPLAINSAQVQEMVAMAKQKQVFLMEALWTKFLPSTCKAMELIEQGAIGEVKSVRADFGFRADFTPEGRLFDRKVGGGSLLDIGIYPLFLATTILGKPTQVSALAHFGATQVDEHCGMSLTYANGAMATLYSTIVATTAVEAHIAGTKGSIHIHDRWHAPTAYITLHQEAKESSKLRFDTIGNGYNYEAAEVMQCLREGRIQSPRMSHQDSLLLMEVMDWVRKEAGIQYAEDK